VRASQAAQQADLLPTANFTVRDAEASSAAGADALLRLTSGRAMPGALVSFLRGRDVPCGRARRRRARVVHMGPSEEAALLANNAPYRAAAPYPCPGL